MSDSTVVPLPSTVAGPVGDDSSAPIGDDSGSSLQSDISLNTILSAIYALAQEVRDVSETLSQQIAAAITAIDAATTANAAAITTLETMLVGQPTAAQVADLTTAAAGVTAQSVTLTGLVAPPTPTPAPPAA